MRRDRREGRDNKANIRFSKFDEPAQKLRLKQLLRSEVKCARVD
jgi:hypothetical protein